MVKILIVIGALLAVGTLVFAAMLSLTFAVINLLINIFTVAFTEEFRWYGPDLDDLEPGLVDGIVLAGGAGLILLVTGLALRRILAPPPPRPPGPAAPTAWPPPAAPPWPPPPPEG